MARGAGTEADRYPAGRGAGVGDHPPIEGKARSAKVLCNDAPSGRRAGTDHAPKTGVPRGGAGGKPGETK